VLARRLLCALSLVSLSCFVISPAPAEDVIETYRSPFGTPRSASVDSTDCSCWGTDTDGGQVVRLALPGYRIPTFYDVLPPHWALAHVDACFRAGIVAGFPDGLYHPGLPVSRDQMAVYIARAFDLPM